MMDEREKVILVGVELFRDQDMDQRMEELKNLAIACGKKPVGMVTQRLERPNPSTYIGPGKLLEIKGVTVESGADLVLFNDELTPSQLRNLERELGSPVMDRTTLILEIFAQRARTKEAKLQVDMARYQYILPRLVGLKSALDQQRGGGGIRNRGAGETKLELDRRKIEEKISFLRKELKEISAQRQTRRSLRVKNQLPVVSIVGYTNAGKSTLMNALVEWSGKKEEKKVLEKDMLFATLDTSVRKIEKKGQPPFLLTDTVGFVRNLPHLLVESFHSTLEEAVHADLLLHVVDFSNPNFEDEMRVTLDTLKEIGIAETPVLTVYNKVERTAHALPFAEGDEIYLSAKERIGIERLVEEIGKRIFLNRVVCQVRVPYQEGSLLAEIRERAVILSSEFDELGTKLTLELGREEVNRFSEYLIPEGKIGLKTLDGESRQM